MLCLLFLESLDFCLVQQSVRTRTITLSIQIFQTLRSIAYHSINNIVQRRIELTKGQKLDLAVLHLVNFKKICLVTIRISTPKQFFIGFVCWFHHFICKIRLYHRGLLAYRTQVIERQVSTEVLQSAIVLSVRCSNRYNKCLYHCGLLAYSRQVIERHVATDMLQSAIVLSVRCSNRYNKQNFVLSSNA